MVYSPVFIVKISLGVPTVTKVDENLIKFRTLTG